MPRHQDPTYPLTPPGKRVSVFVKLFIAFHVMAIVSWALPPPPQNEDLAINRQSPKLFAQSLGRFVSDGTLHFNQHFIKTSPVRIYLMYTGFWQYWDMFSPNPASIDFYGTATITYKDGSTKPYTFPRMYEMCIPKKYVSERYRKFYERAHVEKVEGM